MHFKQRINIHLILIIVVFATIAITIFRFLTWGVRVNIEDFASEYTDEYSIAMDVIFPVLDQNGNTIQDTDDTTTIVCFGNAPFADDRDSQDNLANMIAAKTNATVYNCSVSGSYLSMLEPTIYENTNAPMDIFNFYWLTLIAGKLEETYVHWQNGAKALGADAPPETQEVFNTLSTLDFNTVDVVAIMYDASDYLAGHGMYNDLDTTDTMTFAGNLEAGIEFLQACFPHIRIIVMSPTYAYAVDEEGNYVSSDIYTYGQDVLSTYAIKESSSCFDRCVTFVDHIYGTITEDNASEYLIDNLHLNVRGRELVADRFIKALQYYAN